MSDLDQPDLTAMTADIVSAYAASRNHLSAAELPTLIQSVHQSLKALGSGVQEPAQAEAQTPAVSIRKSITDTHLICLEDGKRFKSLKRHLMTDHQMSPAEYRAKWSLKPDYPMTHPTYSENRRTLALNIGLGQKGRQPAKQAAPEPAPAQPAKPKRTRKPKAEAKPEAEA